jgi:hypothetical protein
MAKRKLTLVTPAAPDFAVSNHGSKNPSGVYEFNEGTVSYNGRRVPRLLNLEYPTGARQMVLDVLCHFFRDENDPERKGYALHGRALHALYTRLSHLPIAPMTDDELTELVTTILCDWKERVSGRSDLQYLGGRRLDVIRQ